MHILKIKHSHFYHSHVEYFEVEVESYLANKLTAFSLVQQLHPVNVIGAMHRLIAKYLLVIKYLNFTQKELKLNVLGELHQLGNHNIG